MKYYNLLMFVYKEGHVTSENGVDFSECIYDYCDHYMLYLD